MPKPPGRLPEERQRLEMLVEQTLTQVCRIAEGHATLERMIDQARQELAAQVGDLQGQMNLGFREIFQRLDRVEIDLAQIKQEFSQVKQAVSEIDRRLEIHEQAHTP